VRMQRRNAAASFVSQCAWETTAASFVPRCA
jgi:hypothetical protein